MGVMWTLGQSKLWLEEPDLVRLAIVGPFDLKLMEELNAVTAELKVHHPRLYLVMDMHQSSGLSPEMRKHVGENPDGSPFEGTVAYNASFAVKTMANMMNRASALLGREGTKPFAIVETEAEAKAWAAARREATRVKRAS